MAYTVWACECLLYLVLHLIFVMCISFHWLWNMTVQVFIYIIIFWCRGRDSGFAKSVEAIGFLWPNELLLVSSEVYCPLCASPVCFSCKGKSVPYVAVILPHTWSRQGIHTHALLEWISLWAMTQYAIATWFFCSSYIYLWLSEIVLASVRAVTNANLLGRHSSPRFISLSKVLLNKVSSKKHCLAINFPLPDPLIEINAFFSEPFKELNDRSCAEYENTTIVVIVTRSFTVSQYWQQQPLVRAETHVCAKKKSVSCVKMRLNHLTLSLPVVMRSPRMRSKSRSAVQ